MYMCEYIHSCMSVSFVGLALNLNPLAYIYKVN